MDTLPPAPSPELPAVSDDIHQLTQLDLVKIIKQVIDAYGLRKSCGGSYTGVLMRAGVLQITDPVSEDGSRPRFYALWKALEELKETQAPRETPLSPPPAPASPSPEDATAGKQAAKTGKPRIPPSGVFWDAWMDGYDEVTGKPAVPDQLQGFKPDNAPIWAFWWESNGVHGWVCSPLDWDCVRSYYPIMSAEKLATSARQAVFDHGAVLMQASANDSYGLRREHKGERALADHAREHGLLWLIHANPLKRDTR